MGALTVWSELVTGPVLKEQTSGKQTRAGVCVFTFLRTLLLLSSTYCLVSGGLFFFFKGIVFLLKFSV